jgi:hypothetical protein
MEKQLKLEEKTAWQKCRKHGKVVCTFCSPVRMITPEDNPYYNLYSLYYKAYGHESPKNHKEMAALMDLRHVEGNVGESTRKIIENMAP